MGVLRDGRTKGKFTGWPISNCTSGLDGFRLRTIFRNGRYRDLRARQPPRSCARAPEPPKRRRSVDVRMKRGECAGKSGGLARNRTGVQGFAVLCVTTPPRGLPTRRGGSGGFDSNGRVRAQGATLGNHRRRHFSWPTRLRNGRARCIPASLGGIASSRSLETVGSGLRARDRSFRRGAAVAQRTVNPLVVGSNPTAGAIDPRLRSVRGRPVSITSRQFRPAGGALRS